MIEFTKICKMITIGMRIYRDQTDTEYTVKYFDGYTIIMELQPYSQNLFGTIHSAGLYFDAKLTESLYEEYKNFETIPIRIER